MQPIDGSIARRFLLWYMKYPPSSPYVTANVAFDTTEATAYLRALNQEEPEDRVSLQHLISAAVAWVYREFPVANASVIGSRIYRHDHVGIAIPVNLLDEDRTRKRETAMVLVEKAETLSLRELARATRRVVDEERSGKPRNVVARLLLPLAERIPQRFFHLALDLADRAFRVPALARALHRHAPITVAVSNPGAAFRPPPGGLLRGGAFSPPARLLSIGSVLGISAIQDEVVPVGGVPRVRPMLPMIYVFDHRLFDGVLCCRILKRLGEVLLDPRPVFGPHGRREPRGATLGDPVS